MSESYYFYPPYQASMIAALSFKDPAICHRFSSRRESRASGCRHLLKYAVGTRNRQNCWNNEKLGWDVWVAWIAVSGPLRDRSILHQGYYIKAEEHLACDHDLNISLCVSGKGKKKMPNARGGGTWVNSWWICVAVLWEPLLNSTKAHAIFAIQT